MFRPMRRRTFLLRLLALAGLLTLAACQPPEAAPKAPSALPGLVTERLRIAREVAWSKFHSGDPVHDPQREFDLVTELIRQGNALGLDSVAIKAFFEAQLAASREVQTELLAAWADGTAPKPATPPLDLAADLRPRLDALTPTLLEGIFDTPDAAIAEATARALAADGFSPAVVELATAPLRP